MPGTLPRPLDPTPWPPPHTPVDLKAFVGHLAARSPVATPTRGQYRRITSQVESAARKVTAAPVPVIGFVDGIQRRCVVGRVEHRDVTLAYVSAGTAHRGKLLTVTERLAAICSAADEERVRAAGPGMPVAVLPALHPWSLASATDEYIDGTRRALELEALADAPTSAGAVVVVDGSLPPSCTRSDLVGVIKSATETDWLTDPALFPTTQGWRSPALLLPAGEVGKRDRLSAYVRLRSATGQHAWTFSLVRVEVFADQGIALLDAAAAMVISQRQPLGSGDPRAETHLNGFRHAEEQLRARAPFGIDVLNR